MSGQRIPVPRLPHLPNLLPQLLPFMFHEEAELRGREFPEASRAELRHGDQVHPPGCEEACRAGVRTATRAASAEGVPSPPSGKPATVLL